MAKLDNHHFNSTSLWSILVFDINICVYGQQEKANAKCVLKQLSMDLIYIEIRTEEMHRP
jgi:hypothetical protein